MTNTERKLTASRLADDFVRQLESKGTVTKDGEGLRRLISQKLLTMGAGESAERKTTKLAARASGCMNIPPCLCARCGKWLSPGGYELALAPDGRGKLYVCRPRCKERI